MGTLSSLRKSGIEVLRNSVNASMLESGNNYPIITNQTNLIKSYKKQTSSIPKKNTKRLVTISSR